MSCGAALKRCRQSLLLITTTGWPTDSYSIGRKNRPSNGRALECGEELRRYHGTRDGIGVGRKGKPANRVAAIGGLDVFARTFAARGGNRRDAQRAQDSECQASYAPNVRCSARRTTRSLLRSGASEIRGRIAITLTSVDRPLGIGAGRRVHRTFPAESVFVISRLAGARLVLHPPLQRRERIDPASLIPGPSRYRSGPSPAA